MCEGKEYNEKSDLWALGCILGEMCCRQKTFMASNLSELVKKIMTVSIKKFTWLIFDLIFWIYVIAQAEFTPLPEGYSEELQQLLQILLQINPQDRPSARELNEIHIPKVLKKLGKFEGYAYESEKNPDGDGDSTVFGPVASREYLEASTATMNDLILTERSILYLLKSFGSNFSLDPIQLPSTSKIRDISISESHFLVVTEEGNVFGWGDGHKGQLGQNIEATWKHFPSKIETLQRHNVVSACAGDGFSLFLTNYGVLLSCGTSNFGCLGMKGVTTLMTPKVIQKFHDIKIIQIACHKNHVLALDIHGNVYAFGHNENGALGLGTRTTSMTPQRVSSASSIRSIKKIYCAPDCSLILTHDGTVYACGSNNFNRLGFGGNVEHVNEFVSMSFKSKNIASFLSFSAAENFLHQEESHWPECICEPFRTDNLRWICRDDGR